ncbi:hypothetical protein ACNRWW_04120 [Metabacillus sp. HB246100]|uniref:hypothetical protein n=1 Tax=Bacillus weihaiensis TaxID=1547283 RepID=UPI0023531F2D|nr:hypothetical protein [Bacillus weihaiensis]
MSEHKRVNEERKEKTRSRPSLIGATLIKYVTYLIIFFAVIWFLIRYIIPLFD